MLSTVIKFLGNVGKENKLYVFEFKGSKELNLQKPNTATETRRERERERVTLEDD